MEGGWLRRGGEGRAGGGKGERESPVSRAEPPALKRVSMRDQAERSRRASLSRKSTSRSVTTFKSGNPERRLVTAEEPL